MRKFVLIEWKYMMINWPQVDVMRESVRFTFLCLEAISTKLFV